MQAKSINEFETLVDYTVWVCALLLICVAGNALKIPDPFVDVSILDLGSTLEV